MKFPYTERIKEKDGLIVYCPFNDADGDAVNQAPDTIGTLDGTVFGCTRGINGLIGKAYGFDGNDYVSIPHTPNYANTDTWTYLCWIKAPIQTSSEKIAFGSVREAGAQDPIIQVGFETDAEVRVFLRDNNGVNTTILAPYTGNLWNLWAIRRNAISSFSLIKDGVVVGMSTATLGGINLTANNMFVGAQNNRGTPNLNMVDAVMQHFQIYNIALPTDEILDIAKFAPPFPTHFRT